MKRISYKVAKAIEQAGYLFSIEVNEYFTEYFPYYIEVWLWLWKQKNISIDILGYYDMKTLTHINGELKGFNDPEEAIKSAIEYVVDNKLIK